MARLCNSLGCQKNISIDVHQFLSLAYLCLANTSTFQYLLYVGIHCKLIPNRIELTPARILFDCNYILRLQSQRFPQNLAPNLPNLLNTNHVLNTPISPVCLLVNSHLQQQSSTFNNHCLISVTLPLIPKASRCQAGDGILITSCVASSLSSIVA